MTQRVYHVRVPAEAVCLKSVRSFVTSVLDQELADEVEMVVLALGEACSNIVKHRTPMAGHDDIDLFIEVEPALIRFRFGCFCAKADLPAIKPRDLADVRPGGLGTHFITEIMDRVAYEPDPKTPGVMNLVLEKRRGTTKAAPGAPGAKP